MIKPINATTATDTATISTLLEVAVFAPVQQLYSYLPPTTLAEHAQPLPNPTQLLGWRVLVPFGKRMAVGVVVQITPAPTPLSPQNDTGHSNTLPSSDTNATALHLKPILQLLDDDALFNELELRLARWLSKFYFYPLGLTLKEMLPVKLRSAKTHIKHANCDLSLSHSPGASKTSLIIHPPGFTLRPAAQQLLTTLYPQLDYYHCFLLYGCTNSGKTEIYLQLTARLLQQGRQTLVLVPEIGLTPQTVARFTKRFVNAQLVLFHSRLTDGQRLQAWQQCFTDQAQIVIGTRSALFLPLRRLGLIIIDEEHDSSFKQESKLRYLAREVALVKAKLANIPLLLGSATPSLESWYNALQGRYTLLNLPARTAEHSDLRWSASNPSSQPKLQLVDINREKLSKGFSTTLLREMENCLTNHQQVLIFLNRRGFAATLFCPQCNWTADCPHCDSHLTLHKFTRQLICHHCEYRLPLMERCPQCHSVPLKIKGRGTEGLEAALGEIFPQFAIARIDRDTTSKKGALPQLLQGILDNQYQILIGTQILAKGHHFPNIALVAILNVDAGLFSSDFHQEEQLAQLIVQVMGRAGRGELPGRVILQTSYPEHPIFQELRAPNYSAFLQRCLAERTEATLPPISRHALLQAESKQRPQVWTFLQQLVQVTRRQIIGKLCDADQLQLWGPAALLIERKADYFRAQLVIQGTNSKILHRVLAYLVHYIHHQLNPPRTLRWFVDINPLNLLA